MVDRQFNFHDGEKGSALAVRVNQGKGESCFTKVLKDGTVVVHLELTEGELNARLIDFISQGLNVPKKRVQVVAGEDGTNKLVSIIDMKPKQIQRIILDLIS